MHPLSPNLTTLSDAELQKKYSELQKRLGQAWRCMWPASWSHGFHKYKW